MPWEWRQQQDADAKAQADLDAVRWLERPPGMERPVADTRVHVSDPSAPNPAIGAQAVRVGRTVYVTTQVAVNDSGEIVGAGDLAAQAAQAFHNLTTVLDAAHAIPSDVVRLTIHVVHYTPEDLPIIRAAGRAFFTVPRPPTVTILGVESLERPGLLVGVEAIAVQGGGD